MTIEAESQENYSSCACLIVPFRETLVVAMKLSFNASEKLFSVGGNSYFQLHSKDMAFKGIPRGLVVHKDSCD